MALQAADRVVGEAGEAVDQGVHQRFGDRAAEHRAAEAEPGAQQQTGRACSHQRHGDQAAERSAEAPGEGAPQRSAETSTDQAAGVLKSPAVEDLLGAVAVAAHNGLVGLQGAHGKTHDRQPVVDPCEQPREL